MRADTSDVGATTLPDPITVPRLIPRRPMSDERLAARVGRGDTEAFEALHERYREALGRYCRSIVRDPEDARDALQNTMISVLRGLQAQSLSGPLRPWLYRIAHNESVSLLRRRRPGEELTAELPDQLEAPDRTGARMRLAELLDDLRMLPERQRGALVMRELGGLDYGEIGAALEISADAARRTVHEARLSLADFAAGRQTGCLEITRRISDGDARALRGRRVRAHLRDCSACSAFEHGLRQRRGALALLPALPTVSVGAIVGGALPTGGALTAAAGSAGLFGGAGVTLAGGGAAAVKCLAVCGALAVAGAGVIVTNHLSHAATHHLASAGAGGSRSAGPPLRTARQAAAGPSVSAVVRSALPATQPAAHASLKPPAGALRAGDQSAARSPVSAVSPSRPHSPKAAAILPAASQPVIPSGTVPAPAPPQARWMPSHFSAPQPRAAWTAPRRFWAPPASTQPAGAAGEPHPWTAPGETTQTRGWTPATPPSGEGTTTSAQRPTYPETARQGSGDWWSTRPVQPAQPTLPAAGTGSTADGARSTGTGTGTSSDGTGASGTSTTGQTAPASAAPGPASAAPAPSGSLPK